MDPSCKPTLFGLTYASSKYSVYVMARVQKADVVVFCQEHSKSIEVECCCWHQRQDVFRMQGSCAIVEDLLKDCAQSGENRICICGPE